jgi:hypothetical protein
MGIASVRLSRLRQEDVAESRTVFRDGHERIGPVELHCLEGPVEVIRSAHHQVLKRHSNAAGRDL